MRVNAKKEEFEKIENAFNVFLKDTPDSVAAMEAIEKSLHTCFPDYTFTVVTVINNHYPEQFFVMSVFPERSTADKIVEAVLQNKDYKVVKDLWEKNTSWRIELDAKALREGFTARELTASLLHEVGHVTFSNSIPQRLSTILRYEIAKTTMPIKAIASTRLFRPILSLTVLNACSMDKNKDSLKEELKADQFAKKMGYGKDLQSMLNKLIKMEQKSSIRNTPSLNDKISVPAQFSLKNIEDFRRRERDLAKNDVKSLFEACDSPYIKEVLSDYMESVFNEHNENAIDRAMLFAEADYVTEFFEFGKTHLKKIDPAQIDYIQVKINEIHTENDKMMLLTYLYSKLDMVNYYLSILQSDSKASRRFTVPDSEATLLGYKKRLEAMREKILDYRIPLRNKDMLVTWPTSYEG